MAEVIEIPIELAHPIHSATWEDYLQRVENPQTEFERVFFNQGQLWIDMGNEGINHSRFNKLLTMSMYAWFSRNAELEFDLLGGCTIEKPLNQGAAPDEVLYIGDGFPQWQTGEARRINLDQWRVPDLVAEISDTTLAVDLDAKKRLYLALGIPEYWVIDVKGRQVLDFQLIDGNYQQCLESAALADLPINLVEQSLDQMVKNNGSAAKWFAAQIKNLPKNLPSKFD
jgi:Uma2 family endonuclease